MSFQYILRNVLLSFILGGRVVMGIGKSQEEIEALLHAMNQTRVEITISDDGEKHSSQIRFAGRKRTEIAKLR